MGGGGVVYSLLGHSIVSGHWMVFKPFWLEIGYRFISSIVVWVWILKKQHFTALKSEL